MPDLDIAVSVSMACSVNDLLLRSFRENCNLIALEETDRSMSYGELDLASAKIASGLGSRGIGRGDRVGLATDRGIELIVSLLGIIRAGAAYVPLDPAYPADRLAAMAAAANLSGVIADDGFALSGSPGVAVFRPDELSVIDTPYPEVGVDPSDPVYVIFTSGSTGAPKGVELPHRALSNLIRWQLARPSFRPHARVLQFASASFDVSFQEIATTVCSGGSLITTSDEERRDPRRLSDLLATSAADRIFLPFAALRTLVDITDAATTSTLSLREVITAGEQLRIDDEMREFFESVGATLDNQYGPTETHVITAHQMDKDPAAWPDLPPIGEPIDGCTVTVRNGEGNEVPIGDVGELHLGGIALATGYFSDASRTAEQFVPRRDEMGSQRIEYSSGDVGWQDSSGQIHYSGRIDDQLKIRGHRVEPAEVTTAAGRLSGVANCITVARHRSTGRSYLATYVVPAQGSILDAETVRAKLAETVPAYMVPAFVVVLPSLPQTQSGKIDTQNLPDPADVAILSGDVPRGETETAMARIWADLLDFSDLPRELSFFDLGGDSLEAARLMAKIRGEFDVDLPLAVLASHPTIAALSRLIDGTEQADNRFRSLQLLRAGSAEVPALFLIHGGGGNVLIFNDLATVLPIDQTVYGLQWSGWDGRRAEASVEAMADAYVAEIQAVDPDGPYRLGGHCLGGLIAIEVARRLIANGGQVDGPLIVSDAPNLSASTYVVREPDATTNSQARFDVLCREILDAVPNQLRQGDWTGMIRLPVSGEQPAHYRPRGVRGLVRRVPGLRRGLRSGRATAERVVVRAHLISGRTLPPSWRLRYCQQTLRPAARNHRPRPYEGDVIYFRTATPAGRDMALTGWWDDPYLGFAELAGGRFTPHIVGGMHNDALEGEFAAERVRRAFD